jgi:hypothetical protein
MVSGTVTMAQSSAKMSSTDGDHEFALKFPSMEMHWSMYEMQGTFAFFIRVFV